MAQKQNVFTQTFLASSIYFEKQNYTIFAICQELDKP